MSKRNSLVVKVDLGERFAKNPRRNEQNQSSPIQNESSPLAMAPNANSLYNALELIDKLDAD